WREMLAHGNRTGTGAAGAMRAGESFVYVVMLHIGPEVAGPRVPEDGIHVRPVEVDQPADSVQHLADQTDLRFEEAQCVRGSNHEHGRAVVELGLQVFEIDQALCVALDRDSLESGQSRAGRVSSMGAIGNKHALALRFAAIAEVGGSYKQCGEFSLRASGRLQRDGIEPRNLGQVILYLVEQ